MKPPFLFLAKAASFGAIFVAGVLALGSIGARRSAPSDFMAAIADKHARLARTKPPRILLGGGSNLVFGVDSAALERSMQVPVVNMGLHAGLGLTFMLREMEDAMHPHDIVVLSIEYFLPLSAPPDQYPLLRSASDAYPAALAYYQRNLRTEVGLFLDREQASVRSLFRRTPPPDPVYTRAAFTERGDNIAHLTAPRPPELRDRGRMTGGRWEGIAALNDFADVARRRGVRVLYGYPGYAQSEYEKNRDVITALERELRESLHIELLGTPRDAAYPDDEFFDTVYHLNERGRQQHTRDIARLLTDKLGPIASGGE